MRVCIHCAHYLEHPTLRDPEMGLCEASPATISPVTGDVEVPHMFCKSYRISGCGEKARHFVPILGLEPDHEESSHV